MNENNLKKYGPKKSQSKKRNPKKSKYHNPKHEWISISQETNLNDGRNGRKSKTAVIVFGTTNTGKSSLIRLFCGDDVEVSHSAIPGSTKCTLHQIQTEGDEKSSHTYANWIDTRGSGDGKDSNETILKNIAKKMYDESVNEIQIIWMVAGDTNAKTDHYIEQAKFINSLRDKGNEASNPWESCLIIKKNAKFDGDYKKMKGVIAAARDNGLKELFARQLLGFTGFEYEKFEVSNDSGLEMLEINPLRLKPGDKAKWDKLKKFGYLKNEQIKTEVIKRLDQLKTFKFQFVKKQCTKCEAKEDPRFCNIKWCHSKFERYHDGSYESIGLEAAWDDTVYKTKENCKLCTGAVGVSGGVVGGTVGVVVAETAVVGTAVVGAVAGAVVVAVVGVGIAAGVAIKADVVKIWSCCGNKNRSRKHKGCKQRCVLCLQQKGTGICTENEA